MTNEIGLNPINGLQSTFKKKILLNMEFKQIWVSIPVCHNWFGQIPPVTLVPHLHDKVTGLVGTDQRKAQGPAHSKLSRYCSIIRAQTLKSASGALSLTIWDTACSEKVHPVSLFRNLFIEWQNTCGKVYFLFNQHIYTLCSIRKLFVFFKNS